MSQYPVKTRLSLTGTLIVARDIAHAKLQERLDRGEGLPDYVKDHPIYYAGPAKTPQGYASGSFGPTTAGRMDSYVDAFMAAGGSFVTLAKGNRGGEVRDACQQAWRLLSRLDRRAGGAPGARTASARSSCLEYPELGMEAIWRIEVVDFPAFIVIDDKGNDFFAGLTRADLGPGRMRGGRLAQDAGLPQDELAAARCAARRAPGRRSSGAMPGWSSPPCAASRAIPARSRI